MDMTLPQKLEAIRAVCVKANPDREWKEYACSSDGVEEEVDLPILLSDVLAAMKVDPIFTEMFPSVLRNKVLKIIATWNLLRPSLDDQEEATINLVYEILCCAK